MVESVSLLNAFPDDFTVMNEVLAREIALADAVGFFYLLKAFPDYGASYDEGDG